MFRRLQEDIRTVFEKDPAARSVLEVILCYPGLHAIWLHRVAHFFWKHKMRLIGRLISHYNRFLTNIEIHPGAKIGRRCFIDHGAGVVIGETAEIGDDVLIYQGVVLGGTSPLKQKRHPTIGNNVVIGAGAIVLGAIEVGDGARIGSGSVVIRPVPAGTTVVGVPGRAIEDRQTPIAQLEHGKLPDPLADAIKAILKRQERIERRLEGLERISGVEISQDELNELKSKIASEFNNGEGI